MATFTVRDLEVVGVPRGSTEIIHGPEAATQTFVKGDVLIRSTGRVAIATDVVAAREILGVAAEDASGTTDNQVAFIPFLPGTLIEANLSTTAGSYTSVTGDMFSGFSLGLTSGNFYLDEDTRDSDEDAEATVFAVVVDLARDLISGVQTQAAIGDIDARVKAIVTNSAFTMGDTEIGEST